MLRLRGQPDGSGKPVAAPGSGDGAGGSRESASHGAILLEVVLALALFASAVAVVSMALGGASRSVGRMDLRARAADMAVTLLSEIEMGLVEAVDYGPEAYADERVEDWTWQVAVEPLENVEDFQRVEVTVTHTPTGVAHRLTQLAKVPPLEAEEPFAEEPLPDESGAYDGTGGL